MSCAGVSKRLSIAYMRMDCTTDLYTSSFQLGGRSPCFIKGASFFEASIALEILVETSSLPCSNQYLAELAFSSRRVISPSQLYSQNRLNLLGHSYRHPDSLETQATFMPSAAYKQSGTPQTPLGGVLPRRGFPPHRLSPLG